MTNSIKIHLTACFICVAFCSVFSQNASLQGEVFLKGTKTPLSEIYVFLDKTDRGTITSGKGSFVLRSIAPGDYYLHATSIGYSSVVQAITLGAGETLQLKLEMEETVMGLPSVVVEGVSLTGGLRGLQNVPGSAHYLSPKEIQKFSYTDIHRTLRNVPGVNIQEEEGFGLRPNIGLRGTGSERSAKITLMEDGVLAAPAPYAAPAAYYFPTMGRIHAVEILKGSSQIRFGPYTTGGAINFISTPIPDEFSGRVHLLGGSFGTRNLHAFAGNAHERFGYMVETFQHKSDGFKELDNEEPTGFDKKDFLAKLRFNSRKGAAIYQSITFKVGQSMENSDETYLGLTQNDFEKTPYRRYAASQMDRITTQHQQYSVRHVVQFSPAIDLTTTAYFNKFHRNWYKLDKVKESSGQAPSISSLLDAPESYPEAYNILTGNTSSLDNALFVKANNRTYRSKGVQTLLGWRFNTGNVRHNFDFGLRVHSDEADRFQWTDEYKMENGVMKLTLNARPGSESNRIEGGHAIAAYTQYKVTLGRWTVIPGVRHESIRMDRTDYGKNDPERIGTEKTFRENKVNILIPGIGIDYNAVEGLDIFAGIHKGFSPPGSNEGSKPEQSINYELGTRYRKAALNCQAVIFYNDYQNLLGADLAAAGGTGSTDLFNGGKAETKGLEFQCAYDLFSSKENGWSLPLSIAYTYTDGKFLSSFSSEFEGWGKVGKGDELPYLAHHQLAVAVGLSQRKFAFHLSGRYQDAMRTVSGQGEIPTSRKVGDFFILDANTSYMVHPKINLFVIITNLTNEKAIIARNPAGIRPVMPAALLAGLKVDF
jgi:Fe(3+) dicitrate transport protein